VLKNAQKADVSFAIGTFHVEALVITILNHANFYSHKNSKLEILCNHIKTHYANFSTRSY